MLIIQCALGHVIGKIQQADPTSTAPETLCPAPIGNSAGLDGLLNRQDGEVIAYDAVATILNPRTQHSVVVGRQVDDLHARAPGDGPVLALDPVQWVRL